MPGKKSGYALVVTEKPSVARSIANIIGAKEKKDGYMEGNGCLVSWCVGHLVELAQPDTYSETWKKWSYESLPMIPEEWKTEVKRDTAAQYKVLKGLMYDARVDSVVCATDAGREGELIFRLVYEMAGCKKTVKRLWISSLEENAIREGFAELKSGSEYDNLYRSALCRQRADWLVGINGTRLFTVLYGGKTLKIGRVQTPTLAMITEREAEIREFKKKPYYSVYIRCGEMEAVTGRIDDREKAEELLKSCTGRQAQIVSVAREEKHISPPKLYDLTTLQRDASRVFGFTAKQTLEYTQSLYEKKLVTYPRTDSQYLTSDMGKTVEKIVVAVLFSGLLGKNLIFEPDVPKVLDSGKVSDHHAIIPTLEIKKADAASIPEPERKVFSLIANRLLCATGKPHIYCSIKVEVSCGDELFYISEKEVRYNGWKDFEDAFWDVYDSHGGNGRKEAKGQGILEFEEGMEFQAEQAGIKEHYTQPPKHFTEDTLLLAMEKAGSSDTGDDVERKGLGTPATRADIIEKLVKDGFLKREKKQMLPTEDGIRLISVLPDELKSPKLTADWENALALVAKGELPMEDFMADIENMVSGLVHNCHKPSGEQKKMFARERETLGTCPNCGGQVVKGKYGAYCVNKCGMNVGRVMGILLSDAQIKDMLDGKKILLEGLKGKNGKDYAAYIITDGTEEYHYTKNGEEKSGVQYKFSMEFPKKKFSGKKN